MNVLGGLVARERRSEDLAIRTDSRAGSYSYETFCTNCWKTGNLLRHYGVRGGAPVAVDGGDPVTQPPVLACYGAGLLGATVQFDPPEPTDAKALLVPGARMDDYDPQPGTKQLVYGAVPEDPALAHFEAEMWSENPTEPPDPVEPTAALLASDGETVTHQQALDAADRVVSEHGIDESDEVALRAPLRHPGTVVAGLLSPIAAGGTILLDADSTGTVAVAESDATVEESVVVDPETVF